MLFPPQLHIQIVEVGFSAEGKGGVRLATLTSTTAMESSDERRIEGGKQQTEA